MPECIYIKEDYSNPKKESYYFTDGVNALTKQSYTFRAMITHAKFLNELGIKIECNVLDIHHYVDGLR